MEGDGGGAETAVALDGVEDMQQVKRDFHVNLFKR